MEEGNEQSVRLEELSSKEFTPEQIEKWNRDIDTLRALNQHLSADGTPVVLSGGLAVEAHCGGIMTRPHGDIDVHLYSTTDQALDSSAEASNITQALHTEDHTVWQMHKISPTSLEFRESATHKEFKDRRRLEVKLSKHPEDKFQVKTLVDSQGRVFEFNVKDINLLAAEKIRMIVEFMKLPKEAQDKHLRPLTGQDINEVRRLISQPQFNNNACIRNLQRQYLWEARNEGVSTSEEEALEQAQNTFHIALTINPKGPQQP